MTTNIFAAAPTNASDTTFRAWGGGVSTALAAVGFVKTADTGQINWATVATPPGVSTYQGYEVWRFNDAVQASAPLFFKLEYGSGTTVANPNLRLTIGKGSDGAGAITGVLLAAAAITASTASATSSNWYMSGGDGSLLCLAPAPSTFLGTPYWNLWFERSRAADGTATAGGLAVAYQAGSATVNMRTINYSTGGALVSSSSFPAAIPTGATALASGGKVPLFPGTVTDGAGNFWQPRAVLLGYVADIGALSPISVQGFNTYMPVTGMNQYDAATQTVARAAIAWY